MAKHLADTRLAFIGTVGVPNNYGGFEAFLDSCVPAFAERFKTVLVTCDRSRYEDRSAVWKGARRLFIPVKANGAFSVLHDLLAFFAVFLRADVLVVLGVSGGIFFPLFWLLCSLFGKKLIVNVDGIEWRRAKFSKGKRLFLFVSDRLAQVFSHRVVIDNEALRSYLAFMVRERAVQIAYPGDHVLRISPEHGGRDGGTERVCLTICRIEPENNCELLIEAFAGAQRGRYCFIGNWNASPYGRALREKYKDCPGLEMRDPTYESLELAKLREGCDIYLHGHSVGGTNPSLVEMLFYDCRILAFDCPFNRCTGGEALDYFGNVQELADALRAAQPELSVGPARLAARLPYTVTRIVDAYSSLVAGLRAPRSARPAAGAAALEKQG